MVHEEMLEVNTVHELSVFSKYYVDTLHSWVMCSVEP